MNRIADDTYYVNLSFRTSLKLLLHNQLCSSLNVFITEHFGGGGGGSGEWV